MNAMGSGRRWTYIGSAAALHGSISAIDPNQPLSGQTIIRAHR